MNHRRVCRKLAAMTTVVMPRIAFVVAAARNGVIGKDGKLPWRLPSDLRRFKAITLGKPVIMGRRTWQSLPRQPLPGRHNIVITRQANYAALGAQVVGSTEEALIAAREHAGDEIAVIGGAEIFTQMMPTAGRLYLTEIDLEVEGDTFLPPLDFNDWHEIAREAHARGPGDSAAFVLRILDRIPVRDRALHRL